MILIPPTGKYIIYSDSTHCSRCEMKNNGLWYHIIDKVEKQNIDLSFYFIYRPSNQDYSVINKIYTDSHFLYPIYIDKEGTLEKNNRIFKDKRFSCLVIDSYKKIVYVGDPTNSYQDEERFMKFLHGLNK